MKREISIKRLKFLCLSVLCMATAMMLISIDAKASDEQKNITYESGYTYSSDTYKDSTGVGIAPITPEGYLFAGWYTSNGENNYKAVKNPVDDETYYAKFVPEEVLSIRAQVSGTLVDEITDNDSISAIRFLTSIDSTSYEKIGFNIKKGKNGTAADANTSNYVYRTVYAVDATADNPGEALKDYNPEDVFHAESYYFKAWTIKNIQEAAYNTDITVTPYWITLDGTRVEGTKSIKTVNLGRSWVYVNASANADDFQSGTRNHPFTKFDDALDAVLLTNNGKVIIQGNDNAIKTASDFTWKKAEKTRNITIIGDNQTTSQLNFSAVSTLNINDDVKFENMTLTLPTTTYANGHLFKITENVTAENASAVIYGGGKGTTVAQTNIEIYAGTYKEVWGGGNGGIVSGNCNVTIENAEIYYEKGDVRRVFGSGNGDTVNGDVYVTIGGTFNEAKDVAEFERTDSETRHSRYSSVHGAGTGIVKGDTYVSIKDQAEVDYIYGGGASNSEVQGTCHVEVLGGTVFSIYGGGKGDNSTSAGKNADTSVVVKDGKVCQIIGGNGNSMGGNSYVEIAGGDITRRIHGGCYNATNLLGSFVSDHYVTGYSIVAIKDVNAISSLLANTSLTDDAGISAGSRHSTNHSEEKAVLICNDGVLNAIESKLSYQKYDYLVQANAGGTVSAVGERLKVVPVEGNDAIVRLNSNTGTSSVHMSSAGLCRLQALTDKATEIYVVFGSGQLADENLSGYEAKVDGTYFDTFANAFVEAKELSQAKEEPVVTLLKDVSVDSKLQVDSGENITVQSEGENQYKITSTNTSDQGDVFNVAGTFTINNVAINGGYNGIYVQSSGQVNSSEGVSIKDSKKKGLHVVGNGYAEVNKLSVSGTTEQAVQIQNSSTAIISNYTISGDSTSATVRVMNNANVTLNGGKIYANNTYGIYVDGTSNTMATDTQIIRGKDNTSNPLVNVASASSQITFNQSEDGEAFIDGQSYGGRGVEVTGTFVLNGGTIRNNKADNGAGVLVHSGATLTMTGGVISNNETTSTSSGGAGVYVDTEGTFIMNEPEEGTNAGTIRENVAAKYGAGVLVKGTFNMNAGTISNHGSENSYISAEGAGVCLIGTSATFVMNGGEIRNNYSSSAGVAVSMRDGNSTYPKFTMNDGAITENHASGNASGIVLRKGSFIMNAGATISNNKAVKAAGGIYVDGGNTFILNGGTFSGNSAENKKVNNDIHLVNTTVCVKLSKQLMDDIYVSHGSAYANTTKVAEKNGEITDSDFQDSMMYIHVKPASGGNCYVTESGMLAKGPVILKSTDTGYATLTEAINAAAEEDTIKITKNIEIANAVQITKNLTLTGDNAVIVKASDSLAGHMFNVTDGMLTIEGASENAKIGLEAGTKTKRIISNNGGNTELLNAEIIGNSNSADAASAYGIYNESGAVTAKSVVIRDIPDDSVYIKANMSVILDDVHIENSGENAIDCEKGGKVTIKNETKKSHALTIDGTSGTNGHGIDIRDGATIETIITEVPENTPYVVEIKNTNRVGILVRSAGVATMEYVSVHDTGEEGIWFLTASKEQKLTNFAIYATGKNVNGKYAVNIDNSGSVTLQNGNINGAITTENEFVLHNVKFENGDESNIVLQTGGAIKLSNALTSNVSVTLAPTPYTEGTVVAAKAGKISDLDFQNSMKYIAVQSDDEGEWFVNDSGNLAKAYAEVLSTGKRYASFQEALEIANTADKEDTITIFRDVTLTEAITVENSLKLTSNSAVTITADATLEDNMFTVPEGKTLEIDGASQGEKISITGGNEKVIDNSGTTLLNSVNIAGGAIAIYNNGGMIGTAEEPISNVTIASTTSYTIHNINGSLNADYLTINQPASNALRIEGANSIVNVDHANIYNVKDYGVVVKDGQILLTNVVLDNAQITDVAKVTGIILQGGSLGLDNVTVRNFISSSAAGSGGCVALQVDNGSLTIKSEKQSEGVAGLCVENIQGHGVVVTKGSFEASNVNIVGTSGETRAGIKFAATAVGDIKKAIIQSAEASNCVAEIQIQRATVNVNGIEVTEGNTLKSYTIASKFPRS